MSDGVKDLDDERYPHPNGWLITIKCRYDVTTDNHNAWAFVENSSHERTRISADPFVEKLSIEAKGRALYAAKRFIEALEESGK